MPYVSSSSMITFLSQIKAIPVKFCASGRLNGCLQVVSGWVQVQARKSCYRLSSWFGFERLLWKWRRALNYLSKSIFQRRRYVEAHAQVFRSSFLSLNVEAHTDWLPEIGCKRPSSIQIMIFLLALSVIDAQCDYLNRTYSCWLFQQPVWHQCLLSRGLWCWAWLSGWTRQLLYQNFSFKMRKR